MSERNVTAANYVHDFLMHVHRGAISNGHDAVIVFGNDGAKQEAELVLADLDRLGIKHEGLGVSDTGTSWAIALPCYGYSEGKLQDTKNTAHVIVKNAWKKVCEPKQEA